MCRYRLNFIDYRLQAEPIKFVHSFNYFSFFRFLLAYKMVIVLRDLFKLLTLILQYDMEFKRKWDRLWNEMLNEVYLFNIEMIDWLNQRKSFFSILVYTSEVHIHMLFKLVHAENFKFLFCGCCVIVIRVSREKFYFWWVESL